MNDALTLGVIGHVDHGKTALVRALTGTETDRLREERERGLSIVLGFAYLETADGVVDLIDVPGHEDFVRAMIGGATALDGIVLCVAANEGVMPQTVEHFNIARLLGVERGFTVVTKCDLADAGVLELVRDEVRGFTADSFLASAPLINVSATTGAGIEAVRDAIATLAAVPVERPINGQFFLPLDRVFTMRGFGLVATGTLRGGELAVGDTVEIMPAGREATVRALQNHNRPVDRVRPGQRVAVNLRHVERDAIRRGDVLAAPGSVQPCTRVDARVQLLADARPLRNAAQVRLLTGTTEVMARLRLLDRRELAPGETTMAQLNLERTIATRPGEHILLRSYSPIRTIGGGRILAVGTDRHRRFDAAVTARLQTVATGNPELVVGQRLAEAGATGLDADSLARELGLAVELVATALERQNPVVVGPGRFVAETAFAALREEILTTLGGFHETHPLLNGIDFGRLVNRLTSLPDEAAVRCAVQQLLAEGKLAGGSESLRLAGFDPFARLTEPERRLIGAIEARFRDGGLAPPLPSSLVSPGSAGQHLFDLLLDAGRLVRLRTYKSDSEVVLHASALEGARQAIRRRFPYPDAFALKDVRDLLGSTRKFIVPLMEHFDASGETVRSGDLRRLRN